MVKKYKSGSKVKVFLKKSDFDKVGNKTVGNYCEPEDCPLARAVKRTFKTNNVSVSPCDFGVDINNEHWSNKGEWNFGIAEIIGNNLHGGDKTMYFVTLTKV